MLAGECLSVAHKPYLELYACKQLSHTASCPAPVVPCRTQETTLVHHVFGGYLRSQVICCGCGGASRRYEAALDLQLEVPPAVDRLEDALARHTAGAVTLQSNVLHVGFCRVISGVHVEAALESAMACSTMPQLPKLCSHLFPKQWVHSLSNWRLPHWRASTW